MPRPAFWLRELTKFMPMIMLDCDADCGWELSCPTDMIGVFWVMAEDVTVTLFAASEALLAFPTCIMFTMPDDGIDVNIKFDELPLLDAADARVCKFSLSACKFS